MNGDNTPENPGKAARPISEEEVRALITDWFNAVHNGAPAEYQQQLFAPGVKVEAWTGAAFDIPHHIALHQDLADEVHRIRSLRLTPVAGDPARTRVHGEVEWEATVKNRATEPRRIRSLVEEEWIVERGPDGQPRFARYFSCAIRYLPGSATLDLPPQGERG
jgi:hypothetical protein